MSSPLVSIGLVTWNSSECLPSCLEAISLQEISNTELIIIDNSSTDRSPEVVHSLNESATIIRNDSNFGFCKAHNQAIKLAQGKYYLALNPDVVLSPQYISTLVERLEEEPSIGSAGGKLLQDGFETPRHIDTTGLFIDRRRRQYLRGHGQPDEGQFDTDGEVFGVDGAAPLYRRGMLEDVKVDGQYFDENFFAHKEDVDLAWRARLLGWKSWYSHKAVAVHPRSFRPGRRGNMAQEIRLHAVKNRYLLMAKNERKASWRRHWPRILFYDLRILVYMLLFETKSLKALQLFNQMREDARKWRAVIDEKIRVDDEEILTWFG